MSIKPLIHYHVCVFENGEPLPDTISILKKDSIDLFEAHNEDELKWSVLEKNHGYRCIKVNITFEEL